MQTRRVTHKEAIHISRRINVLVLLRAHALCIISRHL